jgi:drug/metabolite transporter (DMT)-like permease
VRSAILAALATGVMVAVYTLWDARAIRLDDDPFTFLAWFFFVCGLPFPVVAALRWRAMGPALRPRPSRLALRGLAGGAVALVSFAPLMLATRLGDVATAAALRETSVVFAAVIGALFFGERVDAARMGLIAAIAAGAILVTLG